MNAIRAAEITQVHLAEGLALLMANAAGSIIAKEHLGRFVLAFNSIHQHEVTLPPRENNQLRPA